jgi:hypothetical protein
MFMMSKNASDLTGRHNSSFIHPNSGSAGIVLCITTASVFFISTNELPLLFVPAHAGSSALSLAFDQAFVHLRR